MKRLAPLVALCLVFGFAPKADAALAYVSSSAVFCPVISGPGNASCTLGASVAVNGLIITCGSSFGENASSIPTDTNSNTYHAFGSPRVDTGVGGSAESDCWWAINGTNNAPTVTQHWTGTTDNTFMYVAAYTGNATTNTLVAASGSDNLASSTTQTCGTPSATASGQLVFGYIQTTNSATSFAPHSSETERLEEPTYHQTQIEDKTSSGAGTVGPSWTLGSAQTGDCIVGIFDIPAVAATFTAGPTAVAASTTAYTVTFTATAAATVKCGAWLYGVVPSAAQVNSGTNAHGTFSVAATGSSQNQTLTVSDGTPAPLYDIYCTADGGSTKTNNLRTFLTPATGFRFTTLGSVNQTGSLPAAFNALTLKTIAHGAVTSGPFTQFAIVTGGTSNAYGIIELDDGSTMTVQVLLGTFQNGETLTDNHGAHAVASGGPVSYATMAAADILVDKTTVSPAGAALTVTTDGQFSYDSGATGRQVATGNSWYDVSADAYASITFDFVDNNTAPNGVGNPALVLIYQTGRAIASLDFNSYCTDSNSDTLQFARVGSVAFPAGLSMTYAGVLSGTPSVENESGAAMTILCMDTYGAYFTLTPTIYPITSWTLGNYVGLTDSGAQSQITALGHDALIVSLTTDPCRPNSTITAQDPAAGTEVAPGDTIALTAEGDYICGNVSIPSCLRKTLGACQTLITDSFGLRISLVPVQQCASSAYGVDVIYAQTPASGRSVAAPATLYVDYCPSGGLD